MQDSIASRSVRPSRTDLELLSILWDRGSATAREIHQALIERGRIRNNVAYTTVRTYLDRLIHKGFAIAEETGDSRGTLRYRARLSQRDLQNYPDLLTRIVRTLGLGPADFVQWFYEQGKLSKRDVQQLDSLLKTIPDDELLPDPPGAEHD